MNRGDATERWSEHEEEEGEIHLCCTASNFTLGRSVESRFHTCRWFEKRSLCTATCEHTYTHPRLHTWTHIFLFRSPCMKYLDVKHFLGVPHESLTEKLIFISSTFNSLHGGAAWSLSVLYPPTCPTYRKTCRQLVLQLLFSLCFSGFVTEFIFYISL